MEDHAPIISKLSSFITDNRIPNVLLHGASGGGKRTILKEFIDAIYRGNRSDIAEYVRIVDCSQGKGIKFIREDLKFFAKTNLRLDDSVPCKIVVLLSADKLTIDAQSALRRCLELFAHTTRFFVIVGTTTGLMRRRLHSRMACPTRPPTFSVSTTTKIPVASARRCRSRPLPVMSRRSQNP